MLVLVVCIVEPLKQVVCAGTVTQVVCAGEVTQVVCAEEVTQVVCAGGVRAHGCIWWSVEGGAPSSWGLAAHGQSSFRPGCSLPFVFPEF